MGFQNAKANIIVVYNYLKADLIKKQRAFKIGLFAIYLVVLFITMLMNVVALCPNIFIRLSEDQAGEADFILTPNMGQRDSSKVNSSLDDMIFNTTPPANMSLINVQLIDFEALELKLKDYPLLKGLMPRWIIRGNTTNIINNTKNWAISTMYILNSELEIKYGMGRTLHIAPLQQDECYVSDSLYKSLKLDIEKNNVIELNVTLRSLLSILGMANRTNIFSVNSASNSQRREDDLSNEDDTSQNQEKRFIKELLQTKRFKQPIDKDFVQKLFNVTSIPQYSFSIKYLQSPIANSIPLLRKINEVITTNAILTEKIFIIDSLSDTIQFKNFDDNSQEKDDKQCNDNNAFDLNDIQFNADPIDFNEVAAFRLNLTIKEVIKSTSGKWPSASGNVVAIDEKYILHYLSLNIKRIVQTLKDQGMSPIIVDAIEIFINDQLKGFRLTKYTLSVNGLINDKFETYKQSKSNQRRYLAKQTESMMAKLGYDNPLSIQLPLYQLLSSFEMGQIFLENILIATSVFLWLLCVMLIYSIMLGNVDERTYEFGMLRSLGFKKTNLILMIILQGLIFSVPGVFFGLISSYVVNNYIGFLINWYSGLPVPFYLTGGTIGWGIFIGMSISLISSYLPIKKALDANLKETLTIFNKKIGDLIINMIRLENYGISPSALLASVVLIVIGFSTYYIAPMSFLLMDPSIFLFIMTMILISMLFGLMIVIQLFIPGLQKLILGVIMLIAYKDRNVHLIIERNLDGHQRRNKKVSIMFMIALGFVIFAGCTLNLIVEFIKSFSMNAIGADAFFSGANRNQNTIDQNLVTKYIEATRAKFPNLISDYTFESYPLNQILGVRTTVAALNGFPSRNRDVIAIDQHYLTASYPELYYNTDYDSKLKYSYVPNTKKVDLVSMLYQNDNIDPIIQSNLDINFPRNPNDEKYYLNMQVTTFIAEGVKKKFALGIDNPCTLGINVRHRQKIPCKIVGLASKFPGALAFSSYSTLATMSPIYISNKQMTQIITKEMEMYEDINAKLIDSPGMKNTPDKIRKRFFKLKFTEEATMDMKEMVFYEVKNLIEDEGSMSFFIFDIITTANTVGEIFEYFFLVLGLISLVLSFFLIWTSFYSNIKESICEYGIMRSIGVSKSKSIRIYLYEAASIILSSIITGTVVGVVISCTLILQFNVFIELPFIFKFPYQLYFILVIFGFIMGLLGSFYPTFEVNQMSLVKIMKGLAD